VAVASEEYLIKLNQQVSGPAAVADTALARLEAQLARAQEKIAGMSAQKLDTGNMEKYVQLLQGSIRKRKEALANGTAAPAKTPPPPPSPTRPPKTGPPLPKTESNEAVSNASRVGSAIDRLVSKKAALKEGLGGAMGSVATAASEIGGPLGEAAGALKSFVSIAGQAAAGGPIGVLVAVLVALVAVLAAVTIGAITAAAALTKFAVAAADAARSERLFDNAAAGSTARGSELNKVVSEIASNVPIAREQVASFARQLQVLGVNGKRLQDAVTAIAMIESVIPGAGAKVEGLIERFQRLRRATLNKADLEGTGLALADVANQVAKMTGMSVAAAKAALQAGTIATDKVIEAMRKAIEQKFGKTIAAQMMSLTVQFAKLKENIQALFTGLDLEPFLAALKSITDLFSQNTVTGRALKETMTLIFQPIINNLSKFAPLIRSFLIGLVTGILEVYVALRPLAEEFNKAFGGVDKVQGMSGAFETGRIIAHSLGVAIRLLMGALIMLGGYLQMVQRQSEQTNGSLVKFGERSVDVTMGLQAALDETGNGAGQGLGDGMVAGMLAKLPAVEAMAMQMASVVENALRSALGWHSPATLGIDAMSAVGDGMNVGADKSADKADGAVDKMINPKAAKSAAKAGKGGGKWIYIENFNGSRENLAELRAFFVGEAEFLGGT
jgi:hypothetical protein